MSKTSKLTAAYLAGLIDGEGYLGILKTAKNNKKEWKRARKHKYKPVIKVSMTDEDIIRWLYNSFGGTFETRKAWESNGMRGKKSYCWTSNGYKAIQLIKRIYPYMRVKTKQAQVLMRYPLNKVRKYYKIPDEVYEKREELYSEIRKLNDRSLT